MQHEFCFYSEDISLFLLQKTEQETIVVTDQQMWHRLKHVIRAQPPVQLIIFDKNMVARVILLSLETKHRLILQLQQILEQSIITPHITLLLPLLKKEALADAFYTATELGAQNIQLVTTTTSQHVWHEVRDLARYEKVMIAAAEQSKQFILPTVHHPQPLHMALDSLPVHTFRIHCDPQGASLWDILGTIKEQGAAQIVISIGPEGDVTSCERELLYKNRFIPCALTPTVLRATQALVVSLGAVRSALRSFSH